MLRSGLRKTWLFVLILCAASGLLTSAARAERVQDLPKPTTWVSDFAGVLSPEAKQQLEVLLTAVSQQAKAQVVVVTIKTLDGGSIEDFTTRLEDSWKVGKKGQDRSAILLIATNDHKYRIEVGYGLEGILPDAKTGDIGRSMVPYLRQNDFDSAVIVGVKQMASVIATDAGVTLTGPTQYRRVQHQPQPISLGQVIIGAIFLFVIVFILSRIGGGSFLAFLLGMFLGGGGRGGWGGGGFGGGGGGGGGGGFDGLGGGSSGGGGASGDW